MHNLEFLHRDIKPENFLIGNTKKVNIIYAIDFGLSKRYIDPKSGTHLEYKKGKIFTGTTRYCSVSAQKKYQQGRKDDMEAIGNILIYFVNKGYLPWMSIEDDNNDKIDEKAYCKLKQSVSIDNLC